MLTSIASITLIAGLALVIVGLVGGGIEVKEVKVPQLPIIPRAASILVGVVLIGLVFFDPGLFGPPAPAPSLDTKSTGRPELGTAITNHLIDVRDVKRVLQHLGMYVGPINNEPDDAYFQSAQTFSIREILFKMGSLVATLMESCGKHGQGFSTNSRVLLHKQ